MAQLRLRSLLFAVSLRVCGAWALAPALLLHDRTLRIATPSGAPPPPFVHRGNGRVIDARGASPSISALVWSLRAKREGSFGEDDEDGGEGGDWGFRPIRPETSFSSAESVPEGQRPVNEYLEILRSPLFDWALSDKKLRTRLAIVYMAFFLLVCLPIAGATFTSEGYGLQKVATSHVGATGVVLALVARLYAGWTYVGDRLASKTIEYEETGWFDGDVEVKSLSEQKRDKFLYQSEVRPVVERLKFLIIAGCAFFAASVIGCNAALNMNPVFNQYDPDMLEQLRYDEKLAETAARESTGRPTYCDNRYYRAVAGGAQGCN